MCEEKNQPRSSFGAGKSAMKWLLPLIAASLLPLILVAMLPSVIFGSLFVPSFTPNFTPIVIAC